MLNKIMSGADAAINVGIKLISLAIVLQVVFSEVGQLGDAGLVGIIAAALIYRLLDDDIKNDLKK